MNKINFSSSQINEMDIEQKSSFYWKLKSKALNYLFTKYIIPSYSVLDVGCGTGFVLKESKITPTNYLGLDVFGNSELFLKKNFSVDANFSTLTIENLIGKKFDCIFIFDVLEHINDESEFITNILKLSNKDTLIFITVPAHQWLYSNADIISGHVRRYKNSNLLNLFESKNCKCIFNSSFMVLTLPLLFLSRKIIGNKNNNKLNEHKGLINNVLFYLISLEIIIYTKLKLKFGGTIVAVFKKL